ncbi:MAG: 4-(cytidine 5'-diphospho)-2-C-methyl-D-erythritol kinase [Clostridia bacterium]|nr:4-(cytidine 5'-diphospho)-2-C-methyl-D-erythritol kinase [Clostridia bacterium]
MREKRLTLWAPAKINLSLLVGECRADGYHEIRSVMQKIALYDTLSFQRADGITIASDLKYLPTDERNLCVRAAQAYFESTGIKGGVDIRVRKAIPVGAGLGGGSADAACTLRALQTLYEPMEEGALFDLALSLGADVPFCLAPQNTCLCEGVGEKMTPVSRGKGELYALLVKNERKLSTASVYSAFDELERDGDANDEDLLSALETGDRELLCDSLVNQLEAPVFLQKPSLLTLCGKMKEYGAHGVRMSGAGPTVYGLFFSAEEAARAAKSFSDEPFCRVAKFL